MLPVEVRLYEQPERLYEQPPRLLGGARALAGVWVDQRVSAS